MNHLTSGHTADYHLETSVRTHSSLSTATHLDAPDGAPELAGLPVIDAEGRRLGEVLTVVADQVEGDYHFLVVTSGGLLGLPTVERLIPTAVVRRVELGTVHLDRSSELVRRCRVPDTVLEDSTACEAIYRHYAVSVPNRPSRPLDDR